MQTCLDEVLKRLERTKNHWQTNDWAEANKSLNMDLILTELQVANEKQRENVILTDQWIRQGYKLREDLLLEKRELKRQVRELRKQLTAMKKKRSSVIEGMKEAVLRWYRDQNHSPVVIEGAGENIGMMFTL